MERKFYIHPNIVQLILKMTFFFSRICRVRVRVEISSFKPRERDGHSGSGSRNHRGGKQDNHSDGGSRYRKSGEYNKGRPFYNER